jgi:hypothetical protein
MKLSEYKFCNTFSNEYDSIIIKEKNKKYNKKINISINQKKNFKNIILS